MLLFSSHWKKWGETNHKDMTSVQPCKVYPITVFAPDRIRLPAGRFTTWPWMESVDGKNAEDRIGKKGCCKIIAILPFFVFVQNLEYKTILEM